MNKKKKKQDQDKNVKHTNQSTNCLSAKAAKDGESLKATIKKQKEFTSFET